MWKIGVLSMLAVSVVAPASAGSVVSIGVERHFTTNAFDSAFAASDWYSLLRGSLSRDVDLERGKLRVGAELIATRHDTLRIEDDLSIGVAAEASTRVSAALELRGALTLSLSDEGDDLLLGRVTLGTRTRTVRLGFKTEAGIDLGGGWAWVLEANGGIDRSDATRFERDLIPALRLEPDRDRASLGAKLQYRAGPATYAALISARRISVEPLGTPPVALSLSEVTLKGEMAIEAADGASLGLAAGLQMLQDDHGLYRGLRPTYRIAFRRPAAFGIELRGSMAAAFEIDDSDDPLASWVQLAALEASRKFGDRTELAAGVFIEAKRNLLFDNEERTRGVYVEAAYEFTAKLGLIARAEWEGSLATVIDLSKRRADAFVGIRAKL